MTHAVQNLEIHEGNKCILSVTIQDPDTVLGDITGSALRWAMYTSNRSPSAIITKDTGGGGISITDGVLRIVEITIDEADTDGLHLVAKWFYHEMTIEKTSGQPLTVLTGRVDLTRAPVRVP